MLPCAGSVRRNRLEELGKIRSGVLQRLLHRLRLGGLVANLLFLFIALGLGKAGIIGRPLRAEHNAAGLHVQIGALAEPALLQHPANVALHLLQRQIHRRGQVDQEHGVAPGQHGQILIVSLFALFHQPRAVQQRAAGQQPEDAAPRVQHGQHRAGRNQGGAHAAKLPGVSGADVTFSEFVKQHEQTDGRAHHRHDGRPHPASVHFKPILFFAHLRSLPPFRRVLVLC